MTDTTETDTTAEDFAAEATNRAERRRAAREQRRAGGRRDKFRRTNADELAAAIKANVAQWEQTREFHELNVDKDEALVDALDPDAPDYAARLEALEASIESNERDIATIDVAIDNAEQRIRELKPGKAAQ